MSPKIAHIALWTTRPDLLRDFYVRYFGGVSSEKYVNPKKGFESYFVRFEGSGCRLEIMRKKEIAAAAPLPHTGFCHIAFALPSRDGVTGLTERLRADGFRIVGEPRTTGDGYFESVVADPDGNSVEIVYEKI